jgi:hypothetical protein
MYNVNPQPVHKVKTRVYIGGKITSIIDEDENEITQYEQPQKYYFNIQPVKDGLERRTYGMVDKDTLVAVIPMKYKYVDTFKVGDNAYIGVDPATSDANYEISGVRIQNVGVRVYFVKIKD